MWNFKDRLDILDLLSTGDRIDLDYTLAMVLGLVSADKEGKLQASQDNLRIILEEAMEFGDEEDIPTA